LPISSTLSEYLASYTQSADTEFRRLGGRSRLGTSGHLPAEPGRAV